MIGKRLVKLVFAVSTLYLFCFYVFGAFPDGMPVYKLEPQDPDAVETNQAEVKSAPVDKLYDSSFDEGKLKSAPAAKLATDMSVNWVEMFNTPSGTSQATGLAMVSGSLYYLELDGRIWKINPSTGSIEQSFSKPSWLSTRCLGLSYDGSYLWIGDDDNDKINKCDLNLSLVSSFSSPGTYPGGIATDGSYLYITNCSPGKVYKTTLSGSKLAEWTVSNSWPRGLVYKDGYLYINCENGPSEIGTIVKMDASTGTEIDYYEGCGDYVRGLAISGTDLWSIDADLDKIFKAPNFFENGGNGGEGVTLTCGADTVAAGSNAEIEILLTNSVDISGGQFTITPTSYSSYVTFINVSSTYRTSGWAISHAPSGSGEMILFYSPSGALISPGSGPIMTITFGVSESAPEDIVIPLAFSEVILTDADDNPVPVTHTPGWIYVRGGCVLPGDVNFDGLVNIIDVRKVVDYALGRTTQTQPEFLCADVNEDGTINIIDVRKVVDIALGRGLMLAGAENNVFSRQELEQLMMDLMALGADQSLTEDLAKLYAMSALESPKTFSLSQNSPNPFNPSTSISYTVLEEGKRVSVSLKVYSLRGKLVSTLVEGLKQPGTYTVFWDGTDQAGLPVSSGVYIYRMKAGDFVQTRKMVLLK